MEPGSEIQRQETQEPKKKQRPILFHCPSCNRQTAQIQFKKMMTRAGRECSICDLVTINTVKSVKFSYKPTREVSQLLETFRRMCNDAIGIALAEKPSSRFDLIRKAYGRLAEWGLHSHYILSACEVAYASNKNSGRRTNNTCVKKPFLKLDNQSFKPDYLLLRIPAAPRQFICITIHGSLFHHRSLLAEKSIKLGSITITESSVIISISKEIPLIEPRGYIGVDVNEGNITISDTLGNTNRYNEIADIPDIKERYRAIRARISQRTHRDRKVCNHLLSKYGKRERNRTVQRVHIVSKKIVKHEIDNQLAINLEKLKGIRRLYRRGNGQATSYRGRMNSWVFREDQRQIDYKGAWAGVPVNYVNARGSSRNCPQRDSRVVNVGDRKVYCAAYDKRWDRDELARLKESDGRRTIVEGGSGGSAIRLQR